MCLAQGHNAVTPVRLDPAALLVCACMCVCASVRVRFFVFNVGVYPDKRSSTADH